MSEEQPKERQGWNKRLLEALGNRKSLTALSRQARNELMSTELLSRPFRSNTDSSMKMRTAGDDGIGL